MSVTELIHLHEVDLQVRGLQSRLDSAERYLRAQEAQLQELVVEREELETRKRHLQASIGNLETENAGFEERIEKLRDQLNSAVTNKQYTAVLAELNTVKETRGEVEEKILREMDGIEEANAKMEGLQEQVVEREKVRDVAMAQLQERRDEIGERLAELQSERDKAASGVPASHLAVFEEMARTYDGEAMAVVDEIDRRHRDYACGQCHMTVPFEHVALLVGESDELVRCTACARILYLPAETRGDLIKK